MTAKLSEMELAISKYNRLNALMRKMETKKDELKAAILFGLGENTKFVGTTGYATKVLFISRHTDFNKAKEMLDDDVYYQIITETPASSLRVG